MRRITLLWAVAIFMCVLVAGPGCGQTTRPADPADGGNAAPPPGEGKVAAGTIAATGKHPKPLELLRQMADYLGGLPAFSCHATLTVRIEAQGRKNNSETNAIVRLQRPNKLALAIESNGSGMTIISDGKELVQFVPQLNRYVVSEAPADFTAWDESSLQMLGMAGQLLPTSADQLYQRLAEGVTGSEYLGLEKVGDVECHHLKFRQESFDWELWIATGEQPLPQKFVPDYSQRFSNDEVKVAYVATFADWDVTPDFTEADFRFEPPEGAEKVDSLFEGLEGGDEGPHPLLGKEAPAFETVNLQGQPIDLKAHLGKDVVMLDFWATWCGPCVEAMPQIDAVASKFADRGLVFYAVNVGEDADTIKEFLDSSKLDVPVAMDQEGTIAGLYHAEGIPQTVLIGKDGKVQVVHVGFSSALGDELTREIEDLLAGKDLAAETLAEAETAAADEREGADGVPSDGSSETAAPADESPDAEASTVE